MSAEVARVDETNEVDHVDQLDPESPDVPDSADAAAPIRVLLVDDQELFRAGVAVVVGADPGIDVVGEASDGREAVALVDALEPDVVLMDIRMPELDGWATRQIFAPGGPPCPRQCESHRSDDLQPRRPGSNGNPLRRQRFSPQGRHTRVLREAPHRPSRQRHFLPRRPRQPLEGDFRRRSATPAAYSQLTEREREVRQCRPRAVQHRDRVDGPS
jgi:DNA-binding NarL/FixJ family response regulator